jgi:hypothetical protein
MEMLHLSQIVYGEQMMRCSKVFWVVSKFQDYLQMFARNRVVDGLQFHKKKNNRVTETMLCDHHHHHIIQIITREYGFMLSSCHNK